MRTASKAITVSGFLMFVALITDRSGAVVWEGSAFWSESGAHAAARQALSQFVYQ